jgi:hypothetical protein
MSLKYSGMGSCFEALIETSVVQIDFDLNA